MQKIMRWGHDFLRNREGECLTLRFLQKSMCQKETPKNVCTFPHAFTFSSSLAFWGAGGGVFYHPSFMFSVFLIVHAQSII